MQCKFQHLVVSKCDKMMSFWVPKQSSKMDCFLTIDLVPSTKRFWNCSQNVIFWGIFWLSERQFYSLCFVSFNLFKTNFLILLKKFIKLRIIDSSIGKQWSIIQKRKYRHIKCKIVVKKVWKSWELCLQKWFNLSSFGWYFEANVLVQWG